MNAAHATSSRLAACGVVSLLLLAPLGCGGSNTPIGKVVTTTKSMVALLRSIKDPASATAAIPKIKPAFTDLGAAEGALLQMMTDPAKVLSLMSSAQSEMGEMARVKGEMDAELERVDNLKGLPVEFWNVFRVEAAKSLQAMLAGDPGGEEFSGQFGQVVAIYDQFGPARVVELELEGVETGDKAAALQRLGELAGPDAQIVDIEDPTDYDTALITVAPVEDFEKFAKSIDFGDVTSQEVAKGEIVVTLPEAAGGESATADESEPAATDVAADPAAAPVDENGRPIAPDGRGDYLGEQQPPGPAESVASTFLGALSAAAEAQRVAAEAKAAAGPQPGDRDYHAAMAELLYDAQSPHHERAVTELLEVQPTDVADKKVRARIANGYRQLAFAENSAHGPKAIDGLVHWGGKFSAPLLIQLLEKQTSGNDEAIYNALGKAATPEAADAVVKRLESGSGTGGDGAFTCLKTMGPVAEPALIKALPFESPESNRAAIEVLGDIGTRKSLSLLRRATKSENAEVKDAALASLRSIQERLRKEKPATPTSTPKKPAAASTST